MKYTRRPTNIIRTNENREKNNTLRSKLQHMRTKWSAPDDRFEGTKPKIPSDRARQSENNCRLFGWCCLLLAAAACCFAASTPLGYGRFFLFEYGERVFVRLYLLAVRVFLSLSFHFVQCNSNWKWFSLCSLGAAHTSLMKNWTHASSFGVRGRLCVC